MILDPETISEQINDVGIKLASFIPNEEKREAVRDIVFKWRNIVLKSLYEDLPEDEETEVLLQHITYVISNTKTIMDSVSYNSDEVVFGLDYDN